MIKISLKALIKILLKNGHRFSIERSQFEAFKNRTVFVFKVAEDYPSSKCLVYAARQGSDRDSCRIDHNKNKEGKMFMHYDADEDVVMSCEIDFYTKLREEKEKAVKQIWQST